jgi:hypothetical protein
MIETISNEKKNFAQRAFQEQNKNSFKKRTTKTSNLVKPIFHVKSIQF